MKQLLGIAVLVCASFGATGSAAERPPNVVLIISDDQSWTDYGFLGHATIKTPHLDALASESALFTRGYVTTPLCRPSLATLATGLYAHQHRICGNDMSPPKNRKQGWRRRGDPEYLKQCEKLIAHIDGLPTLPRLLANKGYVSHQSGKWWEGNYSRGGFTAGMTHGDPKRGGRHGDVGLQIGRQGMQPIFDFIDGAGDEPFFLWYAPFLPHTPHNPPERFLEKYAAPDRPASLARYYAMCEWFDETCGQLLRGLDERGLTENTLVVYIADNGYVPRTPKTPTPQGWRQSYAPKSKLSPYEGGARTPVMLRWPGEIRPVRDEKTLVSSVDIVPTILAACGLDKTERMPGVNLLDVCAGKTPGREVVYGELFAHDIADRTDPSKSLVYRWCIEGRWKVIQREKGVIGRYTATLQPLGAYPQLYDLERDPHESKNLAGDHPEIVERLAKKLDAWWKPGASKS